MYLNFLILFLSALGAGLSVVLYPDISKKNFKVILAFSGSYLFSITVIHILPELYHDAHDLTLVGAFVLGGFFLQMILEFFTSGVEHGHIHHSGHQHAPRVEVLYSMLISLGFHAFLEGTLMVHPHHHGGEEVHNINALMWGLVMHKIPEAIALAAVLLYAFHNKQKAIFFLVLFSLASPFGLLFSNYFYNNEIVSGEIFSYLFALVAGNFLYISTTIFFEGSPNHKFKANKLLVSFLGAFMALLAEKMFG